MTPIRTKDQLPPCVEDGGVDCWWFDSEDCVWALGIPLLMDLSDENMLQRWTHWLPKEAICIPNS